MSSEPETVIAIYRVRPDAEDRFRELLHAHHPTLRAAGLVTADPPVVYRSLEEPTFFEIFTWKDGQAAETAHHLPEVMAIWEPMGALVEERGGRPGMEFPHVRREEPGG